ncbi:NHLP family bacteriocin export ABC transporter peptidase/permease/ATPase subunit [Paludisphaera borealis]|uniref:Lactococcin-G-processing and transport ATP-binding protein LagD n=1 Tax=Paludisphaera borealis TaxID=1387353 RepID=A0A1U7CUA4_9BACT|nr:NHLP family bacteriocin export ABC transporter peptidase/permease/ATPase subunit [Paludisphaera borealis]APW62511.1 Lactococcin-G-processing and transport ATP-binding protein LagD [Paludisphaera borealis]
MPSDRERRHRPVRTPTVLQMEATECGAAALGIILEYHGRYVPLDVLREDCGVSRDGSNAYYIREAARRYGLETSAFRKPAAGLATKKPPLMVFWQWNHFLVVEGFARGKVYLNDPACGRRVVSFAEFEKQYSGIAFSFEPGKTFKRKGNRPGVLKGLSRRLSTSKTALWFVILAGLVLVAPALVAASFQRVFIDEILVEGRRDWLKPLLIGMGLTAVVRLAAVTLQQVYLTRLEIRMALSESVKFLQHLLRLPMNFYQHRYAGDLVSRAVSTVRVAQLISGELATTAVSFLTVIFFAAVMFPYDPLLTVVGVGISSVNLLVLRWLSRWRIDRNRTIEQVRGRLAASLMWAIQIIETVKATGAESDLLARWTGHQARVVSSEQDLGAYDTVLMILPPFLSVMTSIVILGLGGRQVAAGSLTIGALVAFQALLAHFNQPFRDFARLGSEVQELQADLDRIDDVRSHRLDPLLTPRPAPASPTAWPPRLDGRLELRSVTFGYNRTVDEPLIKDFSMEIRPGRRVALVGGSGAGKSTLARLIVGLHQPWSGEVLHDGRPIAEIPREVFVNSVAMVDERISMFQGTVRDNLTLWDDRISVDRLSHAGLSAAIHGDLLQRRGGYDAAVAEQARNFSGGQRQRLEIARAVVRDPSLLVLDEASSALDPKTEAIVDDHLRRRGCSCLIIAHRLSTIRDCDEIIVLAAGRVVQRGTHEDLIREPDGEYARLLSQQSTPAPRGSRLTTLLASDRTSAFARNGQGAAVSVLASASWVGSDDPSNDDSSGPKFLIEELQSFSRPEETAANNPLPLDDPESVWWVERGQVDVFFTQPDGAGGPGRRRHLCRVEEGGSIFAVSGVRGRSGGGLLAVGVGSALLRKFARGDLMRLSFEESLAEQVALLIDDWIFRVSRALGESITRRTQIDLTLGEDIEVAQGARYGVAKGIAWVRRLDGGSLFLDAQPLPADERESRFPLSEHLWLTALADCRVTACDTLTMVRTGDPWAGLMDFHRAVLDDFARIEHREAERSQAELTGAVAAESALTRRFSIQLAAVANNAAGVRAEPGADPLLAACQAVGRELGVDVRAPRRRSDDEPDDGGHPLAELARASGFLIRPVTLPPGWHDRTPGGPLLAEFDDGEPRPVALVPPSGWRRLFRRSYEMVDPAKGSRRPIDAAVAGRISLKAWSFYATLPDHRLGMIDLLRFCRSRVRGEVRLVFALAFAAGLLGLGIPIGVGVLVDDVIPDADLPTAGWSRLVVLCSFLLTLAYSVTMLQVFQGLTMLRIEGKLTPSVVPAVWDRLLRLPTRFFADYSSGDLALRAMGLDAIFKKASGAAVTTVVTGLTSLFNLALLFWYSWRLALIASLLVGLMFVVTMAILAGQLRQETAIRRVEGSIIGFLLELVGGVSKLRTAGAENRAFGRWAERYVEQLRLTVKARRYANRLHRFFAIFPMLVAMVVYLGAVHLVDGPKTTGDFLAFTIALSGVVGSVLAVGFTLLSLLELPPLYQRVRPILEAVPEFPAAAVEPIQLSGSLALNGVSFRYPGQDGGGAKVLDDVNIQVRPGEFVAIVGASGSGKSTIMRLLMGFETPGVGAVLFDGRELATLDLREVRRQIGVVLQNADLMPGDLYSNIVGFAPDLTMDDAWRAARLAGIDDDIAQLPMQMHTLVSEGGGSLSGGQRQRLLIARAVVRRPRILLLDEATSSLENVTQAIVSESLARELKGTTRVVIAHRLTTVVQADRIYVVKAGKIAQAGRYDQLVAEPGPFQELVHRQTV